MLNEQIIKVFKSWLDDNGISYDEADEEMWLNELLKLTSDNKDCAVTVDKQPTPKLPSFEDVHDEMYGEPYGCPEDIARACYDAIKKLATSHSRKRCRK